MELDKYVMGGNATFTLVHKPTSIRYTYKVTQDGSNPRRFFVRVLFGPDNESDYRYLGLFYDDTLRIRPTKASCVIESSTRFKLFQRLLDTIDAGDTDENCLFYPSGKCARCGRKLTTPESIESGFGPECIKYV